MPGFAFKLKVGKKLGGGKRSAAPAMGSPTTQVSPTVDPRAAPPAQPAVIAAGVKTLNTETGTLSTSVTTQGNTYNLPLMDVITIEAYLTISSVTGSVAVSDFANLIDHIQVADGGGNIFANIPGGTFLYDNYTRYNTPPPTSVQSNTIASGASSGSALIILPNIRIPAAAGGTTGCQLTFFYSTVLTTATAMTITNRISVRFGSCGGYATRYSYQSLNLASGDNMLQTNSTPQSNLISEVFIRKLGTATYLNYVRIQTNNQVIEQQLYENQIVQRDKDRFYGSFETDTLVLAEPGQFAMNSTSEFDVNMSSAVNGVQFVWVWYVPAASA